MIFYAVEEHFVAGAVVKVFAGVDFEAEIDPFVEFDEDRRPALGEFVECGFDEASGALRPRVQVGPRERAGEGHVGDETEVLGSFGGVVKLFDRPLLAGLRIVADFGCAKPSNTVS